MSSRKLVKLTLLLAVIVVAFQFCAKQRDSFANIPITDYAPYTVGKYIIYKLDSTVFINFQTAMEVRSYQVKDIVDEATTDSQGRASFRIRRQIRNIDGTGEWKENGVFLATLTSTGLEYIENNLRYIKLSSPIRDHHFWYGNKYINTDQELNYMSGWEYIYENVGENFEVSGQTIPNTLTVKQHDESSGDPELFPENIATKNYSVEVYAKDIGLVYKDFIYWLYQTNTPLANCRVTMEGSADVLCPFDINCDSLANALGGIMRCDTLASTFSYSGYGVKLEMLEHN